MVGDRNKPFHIGFFLLLAVLAMGRAFPQEDLDQGKKAIIDMESLAGIWPHVSRPCLSSYGRYLGYVIESSFGPSILGNNILVLQDTAGLWRKEFRGIANCFFSGDERTAVVYQGDTLHFVTLGGIADRKVQVRSLRSPLLANEQWLAYQEKDSELVLTNLLTGAEQRLGKVVQYMFSRRGRSLILIGKEGGESSARAEMRWMDLASGSVRRVWSGEPGENIGGVMLDDSERQTAFVVRKNHGRQVLDELWYYRVGRLGAELNLQTGDSRLPAGAILNGGLVFSRNGRWLFFTLQLPKGEPLARAVADMVKVDIWSYKDRIVEPDQLLQEEQVPLVTAAIEIDIDELRIITRGQERLETPGEEVTGDAVIISAPDTTVWNALGGAFSFPRSYCVLSLADGERRWFRKDAVRLDCLRFAPDGRWLVYYDMEKKAYYSYELGPGTLRNITYRLPVTVSSALLQGIGYLAAAPPAGWWGADRVLVYDRYDLWGLDLANRRPPVNITGGYGAVHRLQLRLLEDGEQIDWGKKEIYTSGDTLLFSGFGEVDKHNGFVQWVLGRKDKPIVLVMQPCLYYQTPSQQPDGNAFDHGMKPIKASRANCWLVKRQTASEAPNFFLTTDWHHCRQVSQVKPQARYNWLTAELINYRLLDGRPGQGILYKPEDFDPGRKYPVIFNFYEQLTHRLYEFPHPGYTEDDINIPWFVSRGYLVFTPDIHFEAGNSSGKTVGWWAYNAVVAAALYLGRLPYVDKRRMGLQGHSFGGLETNYLVTHSHLFAAAAEFAGPADMVSLSLSLAPGLTTEDHVDIGQPSAEAGQWRIGATLWHRPELYLDQSAVLRADRVTTPLLMVHNKMDGAVPWRQGVEWYLALRRLGKRAWLLQYDNGYHSNLDEEAKDYTLRLTQFFGYYLKGEPPPQWMTVGVPASRKAIDSGLGLDTSGRVP